MKSALLRALLVLALAVLLASGSYATLDQPIAHLAQHAPAWLGKLAALVTRIGNPGWSLPPAALLWAWWRWRRPDPVRAAGAARVFLAVAGAGIASEILERCVGRARPHLLFEQDIYGFAFLQFRRHFDSMPSSHAAVSFALCLSLALLLPRHRFWRGGLLALAVIAASCRLILNAHYLGDVLIGAALGIAAALLAAAWITSRNAAPAALRT
ncbi:phosphatase PAP2 family protein [Ferrovibrio sp.]|uniref:phosphatase PAP2 family protein n=1 Tax=Ferrovibrio sp. TaxID=1917215 RepID=UPI003D14DF87